MSNQEIVITRQFDAPPELVFSAWTSPSQMARWWGPKGFTNPVCNLDVRPGGKIYVVMRGPNGIDYPMGGEFREIAPPDRLVFTTDALDPSGKLMFEFLHKLTLEREGQKTMLTLRSTIINTTAGAEKYTNGFEAGMTQSLQKLADLLENQPAFTITRDFDAPRDLVWKAWTDPDRLRPMVGP